MKLMSVKGDPACIKLFAECCQKMDWTEKHLPGSEPVISLVLPWEGRGETVRIGRTSGPRGRAVCGNKRGETIGFFNAAKVAEWLIKIGGITGIEEVPKP